MIAQLPDLSLTMPPLFRSIKVVAEIKLGAPKVAPTLTLSLLFASKVRVEAVKVFFALEVLVEVSRAFGS